MILLKILAAVLLACIAVFAGVFAAVCICTALPRRQKKADCLIVLGARIHPGGIMSATLQYRCDQAYDAWTKKIAPKLILCGGKCSFDAETEAPLMAAYLIQKGIPAQDILLEQASTNTVENLKNAKSIMESHGFSNAAVLTSNFHLTRAMWIVRKHGIQAHGIAAPSPGGFRTQLKLRFRETISWLLFFAYEINLKG